ncbi:MAG: IS3 family transposase [Fusobacteriaceae bacterium]
MENEYLKKLRAQQKNNKINKFQVIDEMKEKYMNNFKRKGVTDSMSRRGNCLDNAPIESFFSHLKSESIYLNKVLDSDITIELIKNYIDFYNTKRIQKKLNGLSPVEYRIKTA